MSLFDKTIGIIGAGQLAKMLAIEGIRLGLTFKFWADPATSIVGNLGPCYYTHDGSLESF